MKGDLVVESFLNYGPRSLQRCLKREDESSRKNPRKFGWVADDKSRLCSGGISCGCKLIPAGTRCGLRG